MAASAKKRNVVAITNRVTDEKQLSLELELDQALYLEFFELAQKVRLIPNITQPVDKTVIEVGFFLAELCVARTHKGEEWSGPRQAAWLMNEITNISPWEKWAGSAGLKRVYEAEFNSVLGTYKRPEPAEPDRCKECLNSPYVIVVDGRARWCDCDGARQVKGRDPGWLEHVQLGLDAKSPKQPNEPRASDPRAFRELLKHLKV